MFLSYISNFYHYVLENGCKGSDSIDMKTKTGENNVKMSIPCAGYHFFFGNLYK